MGLHVALVAALAASSPLSSSGVGRRLAELVPQGHSFPGNNVSVNHLKHVLPLPKVHYSWALPPGQFESIDAVDGLLIDYARVSGALPLGAHADWGAAPGCGAAEGKPPCASRKARTAMVVDACHRASLVPPPLGRPAPPVINLNFSPWYEKFKGRNASSTEGEAAELAMWRASLAEVKGWIAEANSQLGSEVRVGAICMDSEKFGYSPTTEGSGDKAAIRRKNGKCGRSLCVFFWKSKMRWLRRADLQRQPRRLPGPLHEYHFLRL